MTVMVGEAICNVTAVNDTAVECNIGHTPAKSYSVVVHVAEKGQYLLPVVVSLKSTWVQKHCHFYDSGNTDSMTITAESAADSITPDSGSLNGGQLVEISGSGFHAVDTTEVTINGASCSVETVTDDKVR